METSENRVLISSGMALPTVELHSSPSGTRLRSSTKALVRPTHPHAVRPPHSVMAPPTALALSLL